MALIGVEVKIISYNHWESRKIVDISISADFVKVGIAEWKTAEGVATEVPYREDEEEIIAYIIGGLRSGLTYGGAATIEELQRKLDYIEITPAGRTESLPPRTSFG